MIQEWTLKTHNQELFENGIDWGHFHYVHGFSVPETKTADFNDYLFTWTVTTKVSADSATPTVIKNTVIGLGFAFLRNRANTLMLFSGTPLDDQTVHIRMAVNSSEDLSVAANRQALRDYASWQAGALAEDFTIWEKKIYRLAPTLCDGDGPIARYRKWAQQFYVPNDPISMRGQAATEHLSAGRKS